MPRWSRPQNGWVGTDYGGVYTTAGFTPWDPTLRQAGCLSLAAGTTTLRNVTLARCRNAWDGASAYLRVGPSAQLAGALVNIVVGCSAPFEGVTSQPILERHGIESHALLALRGLRITPGEGCSLPARSQLLTPNTSIATCDELPSIGAYASCGVEATCTDVAIPGFSSLVSAECTCTGSTFARVTEEISSAELLPYSFGCFTQRVAGSVSAVGVTASSVIFRLSKSATADETQARTLQIGMLGSDTEMGATWQVDWMPTWLSMPQRTGSLNKSDTTANFRLSATTTGMPGREQPYEAMLNVSVLSGLNRAFEVPLFLYVSATTVDAAWGTADETASCTSLAPPSKSVSAGTPVVIPFVGCDREGLQNALRLPSSTDDRVFTVDATQPSGTSPLIVTITYEESSGHFAAAFTAAQPGDYELRLLLDGEHVGDTLRLSAGCACITGMVLQSDGSCAFCPQGTGAAACATECGVCAPGYFKPQADSNASECVRCPRHANCALDTILETIDVHPGFWRLSPQASQLHACEGGNASCIGGPDPSASCAPGHTGPECRLCAEPGYYNSEGLCEVCPEPAVGVTLMVGIIVAVLAACGGVWWLHETPNQKLAWAAAPLRRITHYVKAKMRSLGFVVKLKVAITFCQVVATMDRTYDVQLPPYWYQWTWWIRVIGELDWLGWAVPAEARANVEHAALLHS